jgi:hypothetical protein
MEIAMQIVKVLSTGKDYITVEISDGSKLKRSQGTISWRCNNPGNLKFGTFAKQYGAIGKDNKGHAIFPTYEHGNKAKHDLLFSPTTRYYNLSLINAIKIYAPEYDNNNPTAYAKFLSDKTGIDINTKLSSLTEEQRISLLSYIQIYEGFKEGIVEKMSTKNMNNSYIQQFLKDEGIFNGNVDGIIGPQSLSAIRRYLIKQGIGIKRWTRYRLLIGIEQSIYKKEGFDTGPIDGFVGEQTRFAREQWEAKGKDPSILHNVSLWRDINIITPKNDWPRQQDCLKYFGKPGENQTKIQLPWDMYIAWDKKKVIKSFSCHEKVHDSMLRCLERIGDAYPDASVRRKLGIDLWGGCLNVRKMRGGSSWSMHSWGIAVDFDPDRNQLRWGRDKARLAKPDCELFWKIWEEEGWISLGRSRNFDWMHVQAARL